MTTPNERLVPVLRAWLEDRVPSPDPAGLALVLERVTATPQHRRLGRRPAKPSRRPGAVLTPNRLLLVVAATLLGGGGAFLLAGAPSSVPDVASPPVPSPSGRTIVVATDGSGDTDTLGAALGLAKDGDTILVRPGSYRSGGYRIVGRDLRIAGDGPPESIVLELSPVETEWPMPDGGSVTFQAGLVIGEGAPVLSGLTIRTSGPRRYRPALALVGPGAAVLRDVAVDGSVWIADGASPSIEGGRVTAEHVGRYGPTSSAIAIGFWSGAPPSPRIRGLTIVSAGDGISVGYGATPHVEGNEIRAAGTAITVLDAGGTYLDNRISDSGAGIAVGSTGLEGSAAAQAAPAAAPVVKGNQVRTSGNGIALTGCARPVLLDNLIEESAVGLAVAECEVIGGDAEAPWRVEGNMFCGIMDDVQGDADQRPPLEANRPCEHVVAPASARPTPVDAARPVRLAIEPLAPGVERVRVHVGDRGLIGDALGEVEVGADGSVWVLGDRGLARVGDTDLAPLPATVEGAGGWDLTLAADGSAWVVLGEGPAARWDGTAWSVFAPPDRGAVGAIEAAADGSIWVLWTDPVQRPSVGRHADASWTVFPGPLGPLEGVSNRGRGSFAVTRDGTAWVGGSAHHAFERHPYWEAFAWRGLVRHDGDGWTPVRTVDPGLDLEAGPLVAGPDGSLWAYVTSCEVDGAVTVSRSSGCEADGATYRPWLARFDGREWRLFADLDGVPMLEGFQTFESTLEVAPDGTLWIGLTGGLGEGCPGVLSFDGETWARYLEGECVDDLAVGPDGAVWARSYGRQDDEPRDPGLYRVTPRS